MSLCALLSTSELLLALKQILNIILINYNYLPQLTAGLDYVPVAPTPLQFTSTLNSHELTVDIISDDVREDNETIELILTGNSLEISDGRSLPFPSDHIQIVMNRSQLIIHDADGTMIFNILDSLI